MSWKQAIKKDKDDENLEESPLEDTGYSGDWFGGHSGAGLFNEASNDKLESYLQNKKKEGGNFLDSGQRDDIAECARKLEGLLEHDENFSASMPQESVNKLMSALTDMMIVLDTMVD